MMANPGSDEAIAAGCICAVLDNAHGFGYLGVPGRWIYTVGCPVHKTASDGMCLNGCGRASIGGERYCGGRCEAEVRGDRG